MDHAASSDPSGERARLVEALARTAGGDRSALAELYQHTSAKLFGICLRILGNRGEAEDALQDIYVTIWRKAGSFDPARGSAIAWLAATARNRAIDRLRSAGGRRYEPIEGAFEIADPSASAPDRIVAEQEQARLQHCIDELEARQAEAITSAFFGGFTYTELAERSSVPLGTMKSWVRRGLLRLKECLGRD